MKVLVSYDKHELLSQQTTGDVLNPLELYNFVQDPALHRSGGDSRGLSLKERIGRAAKALVTHNEVNQQTKAVNTGNDPLKVYDPALQQSGGYPRGQPFEIARPGPERVGGAVKAFVIYDKYELLSQQTTRDVLNPLELYNFVPDSALHQSGGYSRGLSSKIARPDPEDFP
jgi:hypothetical protein